MQKYRFGEFELDLEALQLRLHDEPVRLERRPLDLLILLIRNRGRLVAREEIIGALWPERIIIDFESGLNTLVRKVRSALGDSSDHPRFIETVPGRGYRFIAPVAELPPASAARQPAELPARPRSKSRLAAVSLLLLLAAGATIFWQVRSMKPAETRIAVLPFENLTGDDEFSYLASGLAEETSTSLARIDLANLSVVGGVSARALADSELPVQQIGRELGLDFVVLSSLRLDQPRIRITSRLIRVADSEQVWTASFDRELTNVLGLQRELSIAIAEQVRQRLSPEVAAAINRRQTQNPEAYELYLKGRYEWTQFLPDSNRRALQYFEQAVAEDPDYALAWAGIAHALITSQVTADTRAASVIPAARDALQRALRLGPDLAEAHYTQAYYHLFVDWNYRATEAAASQAIMLDPNSATSHMLLGFALSDRDDHVEALTMMRRARELDPLFPLLFANSAVVALGANDTQSALEFARQAIAIGPEFWVGYFQLGNTYLALEDFDAALKAYSDAERFSGGNSKAVSLRAYVLSRTGREEEARAVLGDLKSRMAQKHVPPSAIALIHAGLGEVDLAFAWLDRALVERDVHMLDLASNPHFESLRADPRYDALMQRRQSILEPRSPL